MKPRHRERERETGAKAEAERQRERARRTQRNATAVFSLPAAQLAPCVAGRSSSLVVVGVGASAEAAAGARGDGCLLLCPRRSSPPTAVSAPCWGGLRRARRHTHPQTDLPFGTHKQTDGPSEQDSARRLSRTGAPPGQTQRT